MDVLPTKIDHHPRLAHFLASAMHCKITTWLGMFKGDTPKGLKLIGSGPWVRHLKRRLVRNAFKKSGTTKQYMKDGKRRFCGTALLKRTQVYTKCFGRQAGVLKHEHTS